jgi:hypothetical protein
MNVHRSMMLVAAVLVASTAPVFAGPCTDEISQMEGVSAPCLRPERAAGRPQLRVLQLACIVSLPQDRLQLLKAQLVRHLLRLRKLSRLW